MLDFKQVQSGKFVAEGEKGKYLISPNAMFFDNVSYEIRYNVSVIGTDIPGYVNAVKFANDYEKKVNNTMPVKVKAAVKETAPIVPVRTRTQRATEKLGNVSEIPLMSEQELKQMNRTKAKIAEVSAAKTVSAPTVETKAEPTIKAKRVKPFPAFETWEGFPVREMKTFRGKQVPVMPEEEYAVKLRTARMLYGGAAKKYAVANGLKEYKNHAGEVMVIGEDGKAVLKSTLTGTAKPAAKQVGKPVQEVIDEKYTSVQKKAAPKTEETVEPKTRVRERRESWHKFGDTDAMQYELARWLNNSASVNYLFHHNGMHNSRASQHMYYKGVERVYANEKRLIELAEKLGVKIPATVVFNNVEIPVKIKYYGKTLNQLPAAEKHALAQYDEFYATGGDAKLDSATQRDNIAKFKADGGLQSMELAPMFTQPIEVTTTSTAKRRTTAR